MPVQYWESLQNAGAPWQTASGAVASTAAAVTLSPQGAGGVGDDPLIPAYGFYQGLIIKITARGVYTMGSTATNMTFNLAVAAAGAGAALPGTGAGVLATTGAFALPVSVTGLYWKLEAMIQCRAIAQGTGTNTLFTHGEIYVQSAATPPATLTNATGFIVPLPTTSGPTAAPIDTTIAHTLGLVGTLSQVTGAPTVTCTQFAIEMLS